MFEKIWDRHVIAEEEGDLLLYVDRALFHEGSSHAFRMLDARQQAVRRPEQVFAFNDHYVPTHGRERGVDGIANPEIRNMVVNLEKNTKRYGITLFGIDDPRQGILHIVPPEQGITQPGLLMVGADSHTSTHGAFGCIAFGIGASEMTHVMATQTIWQRRPRTLRVTIDGELARGVYAKDVILALIAQAGAGGAFGPSQRSQTVETQKKETSYTRFRTGRVGRREQPGGTQTRRRKRAGAQKGFTGTSLLRFLHAGSAEHCPGSRATRRTAPRNPARTTDHRGC